MIAVADASVALKWFLDEPGAVEALALRADKRLHEASGKLVAVTLLH